MRARRTDIRARGPGAAILATAVAWLTLTHGLTEAGTSALAPLDAEARAALEALFPGASEFRAHGGDLPHFRVFATAADSEEPRLVGFAYYTTDIEKLEEGYKGPINFLVGMTLAGEITGVKLMEHDEPYGYFSIETKPFHAQFKGKSILEWFRVGRDIDVISSATITIASASRGIRNSGRRIARLYLAESEGT